MNKILKSKIWSNLRNPYSTPKFLEMNYFPSLDGWRAISIIMVVMGHAKFAFPLKSFNFELINVFIYASFGVNIFFLISGFLITALMIKEYQKTNSVNIKLFFVKRILRIFPVLYLFLLVVAIINNYLNLGISVDCFLNVIFYINNFNHACSTWLLGHTWSLSVEEQFYLIWPFLFSFLQKELVWICFGLIGVGPFLRVFWHFYPSYYEISLAPFLFWAETIFTGAAVAILCFKNVISSSQKIWSSKWLRFVAIILVFSLNLLSRYGLAGYLLLPFRLTIGNMLMSYLIIDSLINSNNFLFRILNNKFMIKLGVLSYSLYIWQQLYIIPPEQYVGKIGWSMFPLNIVFTFITAYISYHYFEVYFLNFKKKLKLNHN